MPDILQKDIEDIGKAFQSPIGIRALKSLRKIFYDVTSYEPGDQYATAFNEGHRDLIRFILNAVKTQEED